jgi:hypothetical protein
LNCRFLNVIYLRSRCKATHFEDYISLRPRTFKEIKKKNMQKLVQHVNFARGFFRSGYVPYAPFEKSEYEVMSKVHLNLFWVHKSAKRVDFLHVLQNRRAELNGDNSTDYDI